MDDFILDGEDFPSGYKCWDLLRADRVDLTTYPYGERYAILQAFSPCPFINVIRTWKTREEKERAIFELLKRGAEGVVFKNHTAPYQPGRAGQDFKLPFRHTATVRVRSVDMNRNTARIEMLDGNRWLEVSGVKIDRGLVKPWGLR